MTMEKIYSIHKKKQIEKNNSINKTNDISMNENDKFIHKYYAPMLSSKNHKDVSSGSDYDSVKQTARHN